MKINHSPMVEKSHRSLRPKDDEWSGFRSGIFDELVVATPVLKKSTKSMEWEEGTLSKRKVNSSMGEREGGRKEDIFTNLFE